MKCLVLDYGGSSVKYALINDRAEMEVTGTGPAPLESIDAFLDSVAELYEPFRDQAEGIAMSLPGFIDPHTGEHFGSGVYSDLLKGKNVIALVRERCGCNVSLENDGKCGALAEAWKGSLSDVRNGAVLVLGTADRAALRALTDWDAAAGRLSELLSAEWLVVRDETLDLPARLAKVRAWLAKSEGDPNANPFIVKLARAYLADKPREAELRAAAGFP